MNDAHEKPQTHDALKAPEPYSGIVLPHTGRANQVPVNTDYACVKLCMQGGLQYQLCNQHCIKQ